MRILPLLLLAVAAVTAAAEPVAEVPIEKAAVATVELKGFPDWLEIAHGSVWVSNPGNGTVQRVDPATGKVVAEVTVKRPAAAMTSGFGSVWVANSGDKTTPRAILRIDAKTNAVAASVPVGVADSEGSLAAGEGAVWALTDRKGVLSRIDPATNKVVAEIAVKPHSFAAQVGHGAVWVTNTGEPKSKANGSVQRIDPKTNAVVATIEVRGQPRFLAVGEGAVWVLNQADGSVSRIDPATNAVAATVEAGVKGFGGDIAAGEGGVWVRGGKDVLLVAIDPKTNKVVKRYGPPQGSGAVRAGDGKVWVSAHDVNKLWAIDPRGGK